MLICVCTNKYVLECVLVCVEYSLFIRVSLLMCVCENVSVREREFEMCLLECVC